jgi:hypothetical protein
MARPKKSKNEKRIRITCYVKAETLELLKKQKPKSQGKAIDDSVAAYFSV